MSRSSRSIRVAPEHIQRVRMALRRHGFPSQNALAQELGIARATTSQFFLGRRVDYSYFVEISERLGLDWEAIAYIEEASVIRVEPAPLAEKPPQKKPENETLEIDWRQVCREMLQAQNQRRLTTNPLTAGDGVAFELDEIYIPLGLVERKHRSRLVGDVSPEQGSGIYEPEDQDEIVQTFQQDEFFEQVLRQGMSRRIAIIGEPGAGKTTLLQKIAAWILDNTEDTPIWISLADLQGKSIEQYLLSDWLRAATRKVRITDAMQEALGELFNSKKVWLLLDGVDEMVMGTQSHTSLQWIANQITGWVADARVVLTCRLNLWDVGKNALEAFETYRNLDFSYGDAQTPDQVWQFIRRWFQGNPKLAERLRTELNQFGKERIKDVVKNPLRLALLCRSWALGQGELPSTKAGLYQQFTEALYEWKHDRFPTSSTQRQQLNKALGELALRAITQERTKFRLHHRLVCSVLGEPDTTLFKLALQLGWLNQVGIAAEAENLGKNVYAFYHPTFQEYFAALAIDDWHYFLNHIPDNPAQGTYRIFEPQWKEVILLWLGREDVAKEQKENFIEALVEFEDGCNNFYRYRTYFLAALGISEFGNCTKSSEIVEEIVQWSFGYFNIEQQEWITYFKPIERAARATLPETDRNRAIIQLIQLIESIEDESTLWQAAYNLGIIDADNQIAIRTLVQLIKSAEDDLTRLQVAESLGEICTGNQTALATLVKLIESSEFPFIRREAVKSLGKIDPGNPEAIVTLGQLIKSSEPESPCRRAIENLAEIGAGNPEAIAALVQLIKSTHNETICRQASYSLGKIDPGNPEAIATLVQLIESTEDESTRWQTAHSLGGICPGNPAAIAALVQIIKSTQDEFICRGAAYSLGVIGIGNLEAIAALVQLIKSTHNKSINRQAAHSLGRIDPGNPEAIAALVKLTELTEDESIRWQAAESLGEINPGDSTAIAVLVQLIESTEDESTRCQAAYSLGEIAARNPEAIAALVELIKSTQDKSTCWQAADSLKKILQDNQLNGIIPSLKEFLSEESYENDFPRFQECYKLIWHCAQIMPYPEFYQAWHDKPTLL